MSIFRGCSDFTPLDVSFKELFVVNCIDEDRLFCTRVEAYVEFWTMLSSANLILEKFVVSTLLVRLKLLCYEEV